MLTCTRTIFKADDRLVVTNWPVGVGRLLSPEGRPEGGDRYPGRGGGGGTAS